MHVHMHMHTICAYAYRQHRVRAREIPCLTRLHDLFLAEFAPQYKHQRQYKICHLKMHTQMKTVLAVCICTNGMHMHVHMQDARPPHVHTAIEKRLLCGT